MFSISDPDGYLSASDVKDVAEEVITPLPLPGVEGSPLDPGDIWLVVSPFDIELLLADSGFLQRARHPPCS